MIKRWVVLLLLCLAVVGGLRHRSLNNATTAYWRTTTAHHNQTHNHTAAFGGFVGMLPQPASLSTMRRNLKKKISGKST